MYEIIERGMTVIKQFYLQNPDLYWLTIAILMLFVFSLVFLRQKQRSRSGAVSDKPALEPLDEALEPKPEAPQPPPVTPAPQTPTPQPAPEPAVPQPVRLFERLRAGLSKTRRFLGGDIDGLFSARRKIDDDLLEELEELLITSDIGVQTAMDLISAVAKRADDISDAEQLKACLKTEIVQLLTTRSTVAKSEQMAKPQVVMVVGVNGVGKTTTIGKLAARHAAAGRKVLIAAADTFRAAAIEQLEIWAQRAEATLVKHKAGSDPAAVAFDSVAAGVARDADVVLVDTAGRLHTKVNLMAELQKIHRSISKQLPEAPHEVLLVLDATTGQNALTQAKLFNETLGVTSIALTKLDGTAKGGIVVAICSTLGLPLEYIGVGEQIDDLQVFDPEKFVDALI